MRQVGRSAYITYTHNVPFDCEVLDLPVLVLHQSEHTLHHLLLAVVIKLDGVFLELGHQVIGGHESEVLVHRAHLAGEGRGGEGRGGRGGGGEGRSGSLV